MQIQYICIIKIYVYKYHAFDFDVVMCPHIWKLIDEKFRIAPPIPVWSCVCLFMYAFRFCFCLSHFNISFHSSSPSLSLFFYHLLGGDFIVRISGKYKCVCVFLNVWLLSLCRFRFRCWIIYFTLHAVALQSTHLKCVFEMWSRFKSLYFAVCFRYYINVFTSTLNSVKYK